MGYCTIRWSNDLLWLALLKNWEVIFFAPTPLRNKNSSFKSIVQLMLLLLVTKINFKLIMFHFSAYNNTNPNNLLESLGKFYVNKNVRFAEIMKNWIYQSGYPIVTASLNKTENSVTVYQVWILLFCYSNNFFSFLF